MKTRENPMPMQASWRTALLGLALTVVSPSAYAQDTAYAFTHVAVIPMESDRARLLDDQTVVVRRGHIVALGPAATVAVPAGAKRIEGRGKFLIPGLADMHAHMDDTTGATLGAFVINGITTIRLMGFYSSAMKRDVLTLRTRAATGELLSPRLYVGFGPVSTVAEMAEAEGFDFIKLYGIDGPLLDSIVTEARRLGLPYAGHAPDEGGIQRAIDVGYASTEHLVGTNRYLGGAHDWWEFWMDTTLTPADAQQMVTDTAKLGRLGRLLKQTGIWTCPTLAMYEAASVGDTWPELRYLPPDTPQRWLENLGVQYRARHSPAAQAGAAARGAIVKALQAAGAGLLLGTDTPVPYMLPGFAVHRELQAFVRAGLTPYEALATGTRNVAQFLGTLDSTGTVAVGKRADLVLLSGNPLTDIRHTMQPAGVMLAAGGGRWLDQAELEQRLAALTGKLNTAPW